jgi:hypothetical protein
MMRGINLLFEGLVGGIIWGKEVIWELELLHGIVTLLPGLAGLMKGVAKSVL